jgi:F0F1-type ATP synthase membrane subunit b/b'
MAQTKNTEIKFTAQLNSISKAIKDIKAGCVETFDFIQSDMESITDSLFNTQEHLGDTKSKLNRDIVTNRDKISKLNSHAKEMDDFKKEMFTKISAIVEKLKEQRSEYYQKDIELDSKLTDKINLLRKDTNYQFEVTSKEVEKMKSYVTQMCEMTKVTASEMVENEITRISDIYDKVKEELITKTDSILKKNKKSIANIKDTCANFFDKYDKGLQYMQKRFDNINETFTNYEQNTIQPVQVREARLHYIETQLKEHEKSMEVDHEFFKQLIKKLLVALEQSVFISGTD